MIFLLVLSRLDCLRYNLQNCICSKSELFGHLAPSKGILCLYLDLVVHLNVQLGQGEGGLVPVPVLGGVLGTRYDNTCPSKTLTRICLKRKIPKIFQNLGEAQQYLQVLVLFCTASDIALYLHSCPSSNLF